MQSDMKHDIVLDIAQILSKMLRVGDEIKFIWTYPGHTGVEGNELADKYAKGATQKREINMPVRG